MISNYLFFDELSLDDLLYTEDLPTYLFYEEMDLTPYSEGFAVEEVEYECDITSSTTVSFSDTEVEQEDYTVFEDLFTFENPLKEERYTTVIHPSVSRVYSFLEDLIVHLMYGYLDQQEYPERDYLVYEEMDAIRGEGIAVM